MKLILASWNCLQTILRTKFKISNESDYVVMACVKENPILVIQRDDTKSDEGAYNGGDVESEKDEERKKKKERDNVLGHKNPDCE